MHHSISFSMVAWRLKPESGLHTLNPFKYLPMICFEWFVFYDLVYFGASLQSINSLTVCTRSSILYQYTVKTYLKLRSKWKYVNLYLEPIKTKFLNSSVKSFTTHCLAWFCVIYKALQRNYNISPPSRM